MKIGILTFWWTQDNYGQLLQAYALQTYLQNQGHDVFMIKYRGPSIKQSSQSLTDKLTLDYILGYIRRKLNKNKAIESQNRNFDRFRDNYLNMGATLYQTEEEIMQNPPEADIYICGSDQVWNEDFGRSLKPYLLSFGKESTLRVAYAASFGKTTFSLNSMNLFKEYFPKFDAMSVRELSGIGVCKEVGYFDAVCVPDPTFLLRAEDWSKIKDIRNDKDRIKGKYTFIYTLANSKISEGKRFLSYFKDDKKSETIHVSSNADITGDSFPSVEEWLHHFKDADFILTNSFHGMMFSVIFKKNFVILPNTGKKSGMNDRVISFLGKCGLEEHLMASYDKEKLDKLKNKEMDWEEIYSQLDGWRDEAIKFLSDINTLKS